MIEQLQKNIMSLSNEEFSTFISWIPTEEQRRYEQSISETGKLEVIEELRQEGVIDTPEAIDIKDVTPGQAMDSFPEWNDPGTLHSLMYTKGNVVKHNNKLWISMHPGLNSWEPGATGVHETIWKEVPVTEISETPSDQNPPGAPENPKTPQDNISDWKVGVSYKIGDKVRYNGQVYVLVQDHKAVDHYRPGPGLESIYQLVR